MRGMRMKGADFSTDFGDVKPQEGTDLPLARIQGSPFDKEEAGSSPDIISEKIRSGELPQGYELTADDVGKLLDTSDFGEVLDADVGKKVYLKDYGLVMENDEQRDARKARESHASKKQATIFDGFAHRVTIESHAGDTNGTYSMVLGMLSSADIRYREVRRYTVDPDRVLIDVLINKEDVDVIKELGKEAEKYNISFTFNDNISEGVQPKVITTPEKDVEEKVTASKKTAAALGMFDVAVYIDDNRVEIGDPDYVKMTDNIDDTVSKFKSKYPEAEVTLSGDESQYIITVMNSKTASSDSAKVSSEEPKTSDTDSTILTGEVQEEKVDSDGDFVLMKVVDKDLSWLVIRNTKTGVDHEIFEVDDVDDAKNMLHAFAKNV